MAGQYPRSALVLLGLLVFLAALLYLLTEVARHRSTGEPTFGSPGPGSVEQSAPNGALLQASPSPSPVFTSTTPAQPADNPASPGK